MSKKQRTRPKRKRVELINEHEPPTKKRKIVKERVFVLLMKRDQYQCSGAGGEARVTEIMFMPKSDKILTHLKRNKKLVFCCEKTVKFPDACEPRDPVHFYFEDKIFEFSESEVDVILKFGVLFDKLNESDLYGGMGNGDFSVEIKKCELSEKEMLEILKEDIENTDDFDNEDDDYHNDCIRDFWECVYEYVKLDKK